jgi:hypothetical protein
VAPGVQLVGGNASLQLGQWLRLDLHWHFDDPRAPHNVTWSLAEGLALGGTALPPVSLQRYGASHTHCTGAGGTCGVAAWCADSSLCAPDAVYAGTASWAPQLAGGDVLLVLHAELPGARERPRFSSEGRAVNIVQTSSVFVGSDYTCGITNGELWCWGEGSLGQLGTLPAGDSDRAKRVNALQWGSNHGQLRVISGSAGDQHTCAVLEDGSLWCWGVGSSGRLGVSGIQNYDLPQPVRGSQWGSGNSQLRVSKVSAGRSHTCALLEDGSLWCWGPGGGRRPGATRDLGA